MFPFRDVRVAFLVLASVQSLVSASLNTVKTTESLAKTFITSMQFPWINGINSAIRYTESPCAEEIAALSEAIDAKETWALKMLDASSKIQSGILQGNVVDLGMYDQCVAVDGDYNGVNIRGKHCMVTIDFKTLQLSNSVCLPSSCNETQVLHIVSTIMEILLANKSLEIEITAVTCARIESEDFTMEEILMIIFFSAVGGFILVCTICDFAKRSLHDGASTAAINTLAKFSLYTNALEILSTRVKPGTMRAINGIRFLSTCWVVVLHYYSLSTVKPSVNLSDHILWLNSWKALFVQVAKFSTENFFMVSGFLVSYLFFKSMRSGKKFDVPGMYFHRYVRLTPGVAVVTLFTAVLYHRIGNGPLWKSWLPHVADICKRNWWLNFFYVQNFLPGLSICIFPTWFLAADMQLFWMSPIILYPLHRWPKYGIGVLSFVLLLSVVIPTLVVWLNSYRIIDGINSESYDNYHIRSYTRAFPYLLGILLGYDVATAKRRLTKVTVVFNWIVTCILMILCCLLLSHLLDNDIKYDLAFHVMCAALFHPCWSIAMAWIIYACTQGYGGVAARFLSLPIFLPLSRLSYGVYLVHTMVRSFRIATSTIPGIFSHSEFLNYCLGDMVLSLIISSGISLFFELPVITAVSILNTRLCPQRQRAIPAKENLSPRIEESERQANKGIQNLGKMEFS